MKKVFIFLLISAVVFTVSYNAPHCHNMAYQRWKYRKD